MHKPATSMVVLVLDVWSLTIWHREHDGCTAGSSEEPSHQHKEPGSEGKTATAHSWVTAKNPFLSLIPLCH